MRQGRMGFLAFLLVALGWFEFLQPLPARGLAYRARDLFYPRPARRILVLGNSRTYYHDMPDMLRAMADASGDQRKLEITVDALPGASFESLWQDGPTQKLLGQRWDDVVLQGESRAQASETLAHSFQDYGERLIRAARGTSGRQWLIVNWNYDASMWQGSDPDGSGHAAYGAATQSATLALAERTGAKVVNVGRVWAGVEGGYPEIGLTQDGNHPTLAGSYLFGLVLYSALSGTDADRIGWRPDQLDEARALPLRQEAASFQVAGG